MGRASRREPNPVFDGVFFMEIEKHKTKLTWHCASKGSTGHRTQTERAPVKVVQTGTIHLSCCKVCGCLAIVCAQSEIRAKASQ